MIEIEQRADVVGERYLGLIGNVQDLDAIGNFHLERFPQIQVDILDIKALLQSVNKLIIAVRQGVRLLRDFMHHRLNLIILQIGRQQLERQQHEESDQNEYHAYPPKRHAC